MSKKTTIISVIVLGLLITLSTYSIAKDIPTVEGVPVYEMSYDDQVLLAYGILDERCRGFSDEASINYGCKARDTLINLLKNLGYCHGKVDNPNFNWHKCGPDSLMD